MSKSMNKLLILFAIIICSSSCIRDIDFINEDDPVVVVECFLDNTSDVQELFLSFTKQKGQPEYIDIQEAEVILSDKTAGCEVGSFRHVTGSEWVIEYSPQAGHEYRLDVSIPDCGDVWAECTMPYPSVRAHRIDNVGFIAQIGKRGEWDSSGGILRRYIPDTSLNPDNLPERYKMTNGYCYSFEKPLGDIDLTMSIQTRSQFEDYQARNMVTDIVPVNSSDVMDLKYGDLDLPIVKNLEETGYYEAYYYPSLLGMNIYRGRVVFNSSVHLDDDYFLLSIHMNHEIVFDDEVIVSPSYILHEEYCRLICSYKCKDMYAYQTDIHNMAGQTDGKDMASIFVRDNITSNINGGIGFFGAEYTDILPWMAVLSIYEESDSNELTPLS